MLRRRLGFTWGSLKQFTKQNMDTEVAFQACVSSLRFSSGSAQKFKTTTTTHYSHENSQKENKKIDNENYGYIWLSNQLAGGSC